MTRFSGVEGLMGPFSADGAVSVAPNPPWHYAADFITVEAWTDPDRVAALLPPDLSVNAEEAGLFTVSFVDWQDCTDTGGELLEPVRGQYRECIVRVSVVYEGTPMHYCPYIVVDQDTSLARSWALVYPKKIGSVWTTPKWAYTPSPHPPSPPAGCSRARRR